MKLTPLLKKTSYYCAGLAALVSFTQLVFGASGTWTNPAGGSWTNTANWSGGTIADGVDALADFSTLDLVAGATVTLDGARTNGSLIFGDTTPNYNWALNTGSAGPLTLAVSSGVPAITVNNQAATLGVVLAGTAGLTKLGAGTLGLTGANTYSGITIITNGILTYSGTGGSANTGNGSLEVGGPNGRGVLNLTGSGTWTFATASSLVQMRVGGFNGASDTGVGAVNQTGGTLNFGWGGSGNNYIELGSGSPNTYGAYNLSGGTINITSGAGMRIGYSGLGVFNQSGGTLTCGRYLAIGGTGANGAGTGVATFAGGTANVNASYRILLPDSANATGVLNVGTEAGGTVVINHPSTTGVVMNNGSGGTSTLNLNSGTIQLGARIFKNNGTGSVTRNYNGGTLQALGNITFLDNINIINDVVYNGGLTLDSQTFTTTCSAKLTAAAGNGVYPPGGVIAVSSGGGAGYIGAPRVVVSGGSGSGAMAIASISSGAVTGVTMTCPGQNYAAGDTLTFTFSGGGYTNAASAFNYVLTANDVSPNALGGLTKLGTGTLTISATNTYTGGTLVNAGTLSVATDNGLGLGNVKVADGAVLTLGGGVTNGYIATAANLVLGASALANLNFTGTNTVNGLSVDGGATYLAVGTYGSSSSPAVNQDNTHFTGTGVINVTAQPVGASVALISSLNPAEYAQSVTFTATVTGSSGTPTGTVTFKDGGSILATVTLNGSGVATYTSSVLPIATHNITAVYNGNGTYSSATSTLLAQVVSPRNDVWTAAVNNAWDVATTANWLNLGSPSVYHDTYDRAQFDDTASGSTDVSLGVAVAPYSVVVSNITKNYSLSGAGAISGSAGLSKLGTGALTISNANSYTGNTVIQAGTLNFSGSSANNGNGNLSVSNGVVNAASSGTLAFSGYTSLGGVAGNSADAGSGVINQSSGTINLSNDSTYLELGAGDTGGLPGAYSSYGCYVLAGGSLSTLSGAGIRVGASGMGVFRQTGGSLYCDRWFVVGTASGGAALGGGAGVATFMGGTASLNSGRRIIVADKPNSTGVFNLGTLAGGNAAITALYNSGGRGGLEFIDSAGAYAGTANFNSGTLTLAGSIYRNNNLGETVNLNFNGGVIQANNNLNLIDASISSAIVFNGGLVVDSQGYTVTNAASIQPAYGDGIYPSGGSFTVTSGGGSGYTGIPLVTVSGGSGSGAMAVANISGGVVTSVTMTCPGQYYQAGDVINFDFAGGGATTPAGTFSYTLQAGDVAVNNGGLTKLGSGALILAGNNSYYGPTLVKNGTLLLNTSYGSSAGDYIVTNGSTLNLGIAYAGSQLSMTSLTFGGPVADTLTLDLTAAGSIAAAPVNVSGLLKADGVTTINVLIGGLAAGQFPLIQYGSRSGGGSFALGSLPVGVQAHLVTNTVSSPNSIDIVVTSSGQPRWDGQVSGVPNGTWDINSTANWIDALTFQTEAYKEGQPVLFDDNAGGTTTVNLAANVHPGTVTFNNNSLSYTLGGANKISGTTGLNVQGYGSVTIQNALNDYTGPTVISAGTLNITNLANGGSPSAIGAAPASASSLLLTNGGNLVYSGPAVAVDRGYTIGAGGGTLTLNANVSLGGQTVTANSGVFTKAGPAVLTYTGTGVNQLGATNNIKAGTVVLNGSAGSQSNSVSGLMLVGSDSSSTSALVVTNSSLGVGTLTVDYGSASLRSGATVANTGSLNIGQSSTASASLTLADNGVINSPGAVIIGGVVGNGVLNLNSSGASTMATTGPRFCVGGSDTTGDSGAGAVNMSSGTLNTAPAVTDYIELGAGDNNAYGVFNLIGGSVVEPTGFGVRVGASGLGIFNQTGGTLSCGRYFAIGTQGGFLPTGGQGNATFSGGTATIVSNYRFIVGDKPSATAVLNIGTAAGGTASVTSLSGTGIVMLGAPDTASGIINLNSGTLQLGGPINKNTGNTVGIDLVNLNGGTLQAGANNITLANNTLDSVNVYNGGIKVDSQANNATISAVLGATTGNGVYPAGGVIAVTGGGSGYIGQPLVSVTTSGSGSNVTANANISAGVVTSVTITCPGQGYVAGDHLFFTFSGGGSVNPAGVFDYTLQAGDLAANGAGGLTKIGQGTLTLSGANTYTGNTLISAGNLSVTGSLLGGGAVNVTNTAILSGNGIIAGPVNVSSNATLAAGTSAIGVLTISNSLSFGSAATNFARLNKSASANDSVQGLTQVNYNGTLVVTNLAGALAVNDKFQLFSAGSYAGNFTTLVLPTLDAGLAWSNSLAIDGSIQVVTGVSTTPPVLTNSVSGGVLTLSWPADHLGWKLQYQTNSLSKGLSTNWVTIPGSDTVTTTNITINNQLPTVFYRLTY